MPISDSHLRVIRGILVQVIALLTGAIAQIDRALEPPAEQRHYCVWRFANGVAPIGIYSGGHPCTWEKILSNAGVSEFAGSGIKLKRYDTLQLCHDNWLSDAPDNLRSSLPSVPQEFIFFEA